MAGYQQVTIAQLRTYFYQQVDGNTAFFRTDEVDRYLREAFRVFNVLTGFWRGRIDLGMTIAGQVWYQVPAGLSYILRVEVQGRPLGSSSLNDLDYGQPAWESDQCPAGVLPQVFAPAGFNLFALWPAPYDNSTTLFVEGVVPAPDPVTVPFVNLGQDELETILDYAEHLAQFKEGGQEFEASQLSFQDFLKEAGKRNAVLMESSKFRKWMGISDRTRKPMQLPDGEKVGTR